MAQRVMQGKKYQNRPYLMQHDDMEQHHSPQNRWASTVAHSDELAMPTA